MDVRSSWAWASAAFIVLLILLPFSPAFAEWQWANPLPQGNILDDVTWGGVPGRFVAVGHAGTVLLSATGAAGTWSVHPSGTLAWFQDVEWNGSEFIAVGTQGAILTSADGETWTAQSSQTSAALYAVTWTGNGYLIVGAGGTVLTSPDGRLWTRRTTPTQEWLNDVAWSGQRYVAVGSSGAILLSDDAITWTLADAGTTLSLEGVAWDGHQFVAIGQNGVIRASTDGKTWLPRAAGTTALLRKIEWVDGRFVVLGGNGTILRSADGITWTPEPSTTQALLETIAVAPDGTQVVVGKYGTLLRKTDAGWESQLLGDGAHLHGVALRDTEYVAVGDGGTVLHGTFAQAPVRVDSATTARLNDVLWDGARYIAVGDQGTVRTSADGRQWDAHAWNTTERINALATGRSGNALLYVAVGSNGHVWAGGDTAALTPQSAATAAALNDVSWSGSQFVAVGEGGVLLTSVDGVTWHGRDSGTAESLRGIAFGAATYVATGTRGTLLVSQDGAEWTTIALGTAADLHGVTWDGARFIVAAGSGAIPTGIFVSADGTHWQAENVTGNDLFAVRAGAAGAVAVGEGGAVLLSSSAVEARADAATTMADTPVSVAVLANDFGAGLRVSGTSPASHGTVTVNADYSITYTPASGFVGTDYFDYTLTDNSGKISSAPVAVEVQTAPASVPPDEGGAPPGNDGGSSGGTPSPDANVEPPASAVAADHGGGGALDATWLLALVALWPRRRLAH